ncbi:MAG: hypothetical protein ACK4HQ_09575 [Brevinematales bacterium]
MLTWMANVEEGEFVLFGSKVPILSTDLLRTSEVIFQQKAKGVPQQTLYRYEFFLGVLSFPYVAVLPLKKNYKNEDILPVLNSTVVAYGLEKNQGVSSAKEVLAEGEVSSRFLFQVKGNVFRDRIMLSWFFDGYNGQEFVVYRLGVPPQIGILRTSRPIARVRETWYEDVPPVGGPYYYVVIQDNEFQVEEKNSVGPLWFPVEPTTNRVMKEE